MDIRDERSTASPEVRLYGKCGTACLDPSEAEQEGKAQDDEYLKCGAGYS